MAAMTKAASLTRFRFARPHHFKLRLPFVVRELSPESVLVPADFFAAELDPEKRMTPGGWGTESDLLSAFNDFDWEELDEFEGIGEILAHKIIKDRNENGRYEHVDEILRVPLFGQHRFKQITGRAGRHQETQLRNLLGVSPSRPIAAQDLRPLERVPEGVARVFFGPPDAAEEESDRARAAGWKLATLKTYGWRLFLHLDGGSKPVGRAHYFVENLPGALRFTLRWRGFHKPNSEALTRAPFQARGGEG